MMSRSGSYVKVYAPSIENRPVDGPTPSAGASSGRPARRSSVPEVPDCLEERVDVEGLCTPASFRPVPADGGRSDARIGQPAQPPAQVAGACVLRRPADAVLGPRHLLPEQELDRVAHRG